MAGKAISFYKGQIALRGQGHTTCVHHKGKTLYRFCETCHDVICVDCFSTLHKGHSIVPLSEITPNNKYKIKTFINKTEQKQLTQIQQEINSTHESLEQHRSHFESVAEQVETQGTKLKKDIDVLIATTLSQLKNLKDENTQLLTSYKIELENKLAELKDQLNQCKETLQIGTDINVFDVTSRLPTDITLPRRPVLRTAKFSRNNNPYDALTTAFGKMAMTLLCQTDANVSAEVDTSPDPSNHSYTVAQSSDQTKYDMTFLAKMDSPLPKIPVLSEWYSPCHICCICPDSDDGAWASGLYEKTLRHLTSDGRVIKPIESPVFVTNISISPSTQNVWACSEEDNSVMELKSDTLVPEFKTKDKPRCLCVAKDGHVLVGIKKLHHQVHSRRKRQPFNNITIKETTSAFTKQDLGVSGQCECCCT